MCEQVSPLPGPDSHAQRTLATAPMPSDTIARHFAHPAGHTAVVRPFAQTSRATVLARGPRVAQASTVNSANTDMNLAVKKASASVWPLRMRVATVGQRCAPCKLDGKWILGEQEAAAAAPSKAHCLLPPCCHPVRRISSTLFTIALQRCPMFPRHGSCPSLVPMLPPGLFATWWILRPAGGWTSSSFLTAQTASRAGWSPPAASQQQPAGLASPC